MVEGRQLGAALLVAGAGLAFWSIGDRDTTETHAIRDQIKVVHLETGASKITVRTGSETSVKEQRSFWGFKRGDVYRVDGEKLILTDDCGWRCDVDFVVTVPEGTKVTGETGSGDVLLEDVGEVDIEAGSADITARGLDDKVNIDLGSGDVEINGVVGAVKIETGSGDIKASGVKDAVTAKTSSGNIDLRLVNANSVTAVCTSGDITVIVPPGGYQVKADTTSGKASVMQSDRTATHTLDLRTTSGDIAAQTG